MGARVLVAGDAEAAREFAGRLAAFLPGADASVVEEAWQLSERADEVGPDLVLVLRGAIAGHEDRVHAIESLRRNGFRGPVIVEGSFLSERSDALQAGADYAFSPPAQQAEKVVAAALHKPRVLADHPYLQALLVGEWAAVEGLGDTLPETAPDIALVSTSARGSGAAFHALAAWSETHPTCQILVVEDGADDETAAEALSMGCDHYLELAEDGVGALLNLARRLVRYAWLERVKAA